MMLYPLPASSREEMNAALRRVGADLRSARYFEPKRGVLALFLPQADFRAAAYIKQELLARGGDAVVARGVISGEARTSPVLLLGTPGQLRALRQKLDVMDCWGLPAIREGLSRAMAGLDRPAWTFPLRDGRSLRLDGHTRMMGIVNLTPDSFHSGSRIDPTQERALLDRAEAMLRSGVAVLDLGAESTRPGFTALSADEEAARLLPAVRSIRRAFPDAVLSVDTWKADVARQAVAAGADIVNDISGLGFDPGLARAVAESGAVLVLSHIQGNLEDIHRRTPHYDDTVCDMMTFLDRKLSEAADAGIAEDRIILDPGLGFGKGYEDNLRVLKHLDAFRAFGRPLLVGHSRKGFIGRATGCGGAEERLEGTLAITALCALRKVPLVRVHDAEANRRVLATLDAVEEVAG